MFLIKSVRLPRAFRTLRYAEIKPRTLFFWMTKNISAPKQEPGCMPSKDFAERTERRRLRSDSRLSPRPPPIPRHLASQPSFFWFLNWQAGHKQEGKLVAAAAEPPTVSFGPVSQRNHLLLILNKVAPIAKKVTPAETKQKHPNHDDRWRKQHNGATATTTTAATAAAAAASA